MMQEDEAMSAEARGKVIMKKRKYGGGIVRDLEEQEEQELVEYRARLARVAEQRRRTQMHHEILRRMKQEREAQEEQRRQEEHDRLLATISVGEQPFIFLADEIVLLLFSFLSPRDLCIASRVCKRFTSVAREDRLWEALCHKRWGKLEPKNIFSRDNKVNWRVTFKNNFHSEHTKAKRIAAIRNPLECRYCGEKTATMESRQRNVQYIQWFECVSCGECWGWSMESGDLQGMLTL